jgi:hypothetical protein
MKTNFPPLLPEAWLRRGLGRELLIVLLVKIVVISLIAHVFFGEDSRVPVTDERVSNVLTGDTAPLNPVPGEPAHDRH